VCPDDSINASCSMLLSKSRLQLVKLTMPCRSPREGRRRLTLQRLCARAIADSKIEILLLVNMPSFSVRLGKN
jgi:hypothetical protein